MKIISTDGKIITGDNFPSLQIGDKLYPVDNRMSTYKKIQAISADASVADPDEAMLRLALGEDNAQEIIDMDLNVESFTNLTFLVMATVIGEDYESYKERALKAAQGKN